jgi:hypothetical protein
VVFLDALVSESDRSVASIAALIGGASGLVDAEGLDIFRNSFPFLRRASLSAGQIFNLLLEHVFNAGATAHLRASRLERGDGELGLSVGHAPYFGVVNVGDLTSIVALLEGRGITVETDAMTPSLFDSINDPGSGTNVLIGSRKFMEGWDSFRVSSLGIMNIGRGEGAQIIQLFGRGVRLWGRDFSLKRTQQTPTDIEPLALRTVETLGVYGVRADYMQQFRGYLDQEGISTDFEVLTLPTQPHDEDLGDLLMPAFEEGRAFGLDMVVKMRCDDEIAVSLDLRPRVDTQDSVVLGAAASGRVAGENRVEELRAAAPLFDWRRIATEFEAFRVSKELWNLTATAGALREVFLNGKIEVLAAASLSPKAPAETRRLEEVAGSAVRKYGAGLYELVRRRWEREQITLTPLTASHPNIEFGGYALKVDVSQPDRFREIADLIADGQRIYEEDVELPSIVWRHHLYQPLVITDSTKAVLSSTPPGLNEGEADFIRDLREFVEDSAKDLASRRVFLLRNLTRGRGVPFFDQVAGDAFYPDFILWLLSDSSQTICFIDPHGLRYAVGGFADPKVTLRLHLMDVEKELRQRGVSEATLTSVILSTSPHEKVRKLFDGASRAEFRDHNVLFVEDADYIVQLFGLLEAL